jgi:hypothetical protein
MRGRLVTKTGNSAGYSRYRVAICLAALMLFLITQSVMTRAMGARGGNRWALLIEGIPGDRAHESLFHETAAAWRKWLTESIGIPSDHVIQLSPVTEREQDHPEATADSIRQAVTELKKKLQADDSLWVFTLGHGNYNGKHAWFMFRGETRKTKTRKKTLNILP